MVRVKYQLCPDRKKGITLTQFCLKQDENCLKCVQLSAKGCKLWFQNRGLGKNIILDNIYGPLPVLQSTWTPGWTRGWRWKLTCSVQQLALQPSFYLMDKHTFLFFFSNQIQKQKKHWETWTGPGNSSPNVSQPLWTIRSSEQLWLFCPPLHSLQISVADPDPDLCIRICIIKVGSGSVWRDTNPDPDSGHIRQMCRNKQWQII